MKWRLLILSLCVTTGAHAQGSRNLRLESRLAIEGGAGAVVVEQDPTRPYVYLTRRDEAGGFWGVDIRDMEAPKIILHWHTGPLAAHSLSLFSHSGRYYVLQAVPSGAVVVDVTDPGKASEAAHISNEGGFLSLFAYKHSDGRSLLFGTGGGALLVYDLVHVLQDSTAIVARIDTPEQITAATTGFDDMFVGYDPLSGKDILYGAGGGGYYLFDITTPEQPLLRTTISSAAVQRGRAITPVPDGTAVLTLADYRAAPVRIFNLRENPNHVRTAVGAWTADWRNDYTDIQVRWPFAFAAALEDGLQVVTIADLVNPYTDAFYRTVPKTTFKQLGTPPRGIFRVDIRNHDGLIVASDLETGFWAFRLEAFDSWHGHSWGMPHMSRVQDWNNGPDGTQP